MICLVGEREYIIKDKILHSVKVCCVLNIEIYCKAKLKSKEEDIIIYQV